MFVFAKSQSPITAKPQFSVYYFMFIFYLLIFTRVRKSLAKGDKLSSPFLFAQNSVIHTKRIFVNFHRNLSTHSDFKSDKTNILHMKTYAH